MPNGQEKVAIAGQIEDRVRVRPVSLAELARNKGGQPRVVRRHFSFNVAFRRWSRKSKVFHDQLT
ncbi:hypothetical protein MYX78_13120, partial [Acidobacteria bacterium AH-259-G07]|nr:hypothetical protein [Acidobacteria bacterium AH-259-G07]